MTQTIINATTANGFIINGGSGSGLGVSVAGIGDVRGVGCEHQDTL